jgi:transcriptional regulator with XRE-family HTH domain
MSVFATRLKEARKRAGLSQERLGVLAGIDEMSASARMNQYERGKYEPHSSLVERLAKVLVVPESFFFERDDEIAKLLVYLHSQPRHERHRIIACVLGQSPQNHANES